MGAMTEPRKNAIDYFDHSMDCSFNDSLINQFNDQLIDRSFNALASQARTGRLVAGHQRMEQLRAAHGDGLALRHVADGDPRVVAPDGNEWPVQMINYSSVQIINCFAVHSLCRPLVSVGLQKANENRRCPKLPDLREWEETYPLLISLDLRGRFWGPSTVQKGLGCAPNRVILGYVVFYFFRFWAKILAKVAGGGRCR